MAVYSDDNANITCIKFSLQTLKIALYKTKPAFFSYFSAEFAMYEFYYCK